MIRSGEEVILAGLVAGGIGPARSRERFLQGEAVRAGVRGLILNSWQRCRTQGLPLGGFELPYRQVDPEDRLVRAAGPVLDRLRTRFQGSPMNIALADGSGTVLQRRFGDDSWARTLPPIQQVPGFVFAEQYAGTNGIGLALAERRLIQVYGAEHFAERGLSNGCSAIPVRDPLSGRVDGILCLAYPRSSGHPELDTVLRKATQAIERRLLAQSSARERGLLLAYLDAGVASVAGGGGRQAMGVEAFVQGLRLGDQMVIKERAAELLSHGQRAAVDVALSDGQRVTLVSRPMTSAAGVEGMVVEAMFPDREPRPPLNLPSYLSPYRPAAPPGRAGAPEALADTAPPAETQAVRAPDHVTEGLAGLVLVGEPEVGKYALAARRRMELLSEASARIGTTLDVRRTAQELAETAVPRLADFVTIDLPDAVLRGDEPLDPRHDLRRAVVHGIRGDCPFYPVDKRIDYHPTTPQLRCVSSGHAMLEPDLRTAAGWLIQDPEHTARLLSHVGSLIAVPLVARGTVLGIVSFYRSLDSAPFGDDDRSLAQELATRAALSMDNARRYTREHTMVLALQHSLLPHGVPSQDAVDVAHRYLPAESRVGGDWYDIIPLPGTRVGLVVGDVVGHGMHSAATMGRLRTAARSFAELDFPPDEVLTHLDNLVLRLDREESSEGSGDGFGIIGATCLYVVYDPTSQRCAMARAGHPPPALVRPGGGVSFPDLPAGPPLGLGGLPFETAEIEVPEGSRLVLYTDGLIEDRHRGIDVALDRLREVLTSPERTPEDTCQAVLDDVAPAHPCDDIAVLVARTHALDAHRIATWELPADPAVVHDIRAAAVRQLADWGREEVSFVAELLLSELVTNALRHGTGPIRVRLLHGRTLICEVSDTSSTSPHLRRAATTDEDGRGLFLVAQLALAWGTRHTADGKVIWAECPLAAA